MSPHEISCRIESLLHRLADGSLENTGQAIGAAAAESLRRDAQHCLMELETAGMKCARSPSGASQGMDPCDGPAPAGESPRRPDPMSQAMLDSLSDQAALLDAEGNLIAVNAGWLRCAREKGGFPDGGLGRPFLDVCRQACGLGHNDARQVLEGVSAVLAGGRSGYSLDYSRDAPDGRRWFQLRAAPLAGARGALVTHRDVSDRRRTEMVFELLRRGMEGQEQEGARFSRELHDGPCQTMTAVLIGLQVLDHASTLAEAREQAANVRRLAAASAAELRRLSRSFRGSGLDDLGLHAALQGYASECAQTHGLAVEVAPIDADFGRLPRGVELALYWIAQEAIGNAARHAGAGKVIVGLSRGSDRVELVVTDHGKGFDPEGARAGYSLGLYAMREWARVLEGRTTIQSRPGEGTTVRVAVPLRRSDHAQNQGCDCR